MFKWFAPLLLFAGKPDVLLRIFTLAVAAAVVVFGVWVMSNVALTLDALKNPYIAATYGAVLFCFFVGVATITWLRFRRLMSAPSRLHLAPPAVEPAPLPTEIVTRRAGEISRRWVRDGAASAPRPKAAAVTVPVDAAEPVVPRAAGECRGTLSITGPAFSGKSALIANLVAATRAAAPDTSDTIRLVDAGSIDADEAHVAAVVAIAAATDGILFVVDQDLRAPEVAAIARLVATRKPLYVVLNKADQFAPADREAVLLAIRAKMPGKFAPGHVVSVAGAPSPVEREIEDARGRVRVELRQPSSDVRALSNLLRRVFPLASGRTLRFEAQ
jgi:hypothetical protein